MFCNKCRFDNKKKVCKAKVVWFFQNKVLNYAHQTQKLVGNNDNDNEKEDEDNNIIIEDRQDIYDPIKTLFFNTIRGYKTALINFWSQQTACGLHNHCYPNGSVGTNTSRSFLGKRQQCGY